MTDETTDTNDQDTDTTVTGAGDGGAAGGGGGDTAEAPKSFYESLSDENRAVFEAKKFPADMDANGIMDAYRNVEKLVGRDKISAPQAASTEELANWEGFDKLGAPRAGQGDKYEIHQPEMPEGLPWSEELEKGIREIGAEARLAPFQMQKLVDWWAGMQKDLYEANARNAEQQSQALQEALRKDWGSKYEAKQDAAKAAFQALAEESGVDADGLADKLNDALGDAGVLKFFALMADKMGEDLHLSGGSGMGGTPEQARAQIAAKERDAAFMGAYTNRTHPGHADAVKEMRELHRRAAGG